MNPGSIGQPRNGSNRAQWSTIEEKNMKIQFIETKYSLKSLIRSIKSNDGGNKRLLKYFV